MTEFVQAESGIRLLNARYIDAVWRRDSTSFADCFTVDAEWKIAGMHVRGRAGIASLFEKLLAPSERVLMLPGLPALQIGGGSASGRTPVTELVKLRDGRGIRTIGIYYDRIIDQKGRWRFQAQTCRNPGAMA